MLHVPRPDRDEAPAIPAAAPTPMMAQYLEIKAANPDCLLFYRMGDFYELFFEDAAEASRALGITLTKRGKHEGADIPMAGVPVVSADDYLQRLIALGYRVAVCEQTEDPAEAKRRGGKSVVRRAVVRLVTPGTITEDALLEPGRANHIAALCRHGGGEGEVSLAWADLSTGAFRVAPSTLDQAPADLAAIEPSEIVVPDTLVEDPRWRPLFARLGRRVRFEPASLFDASTAEERLCRFFHVATLEGFGRFGRCEMAGAAALLSYLGRTQIDARFELKRPERMEAGSFMLIDPATRASLELSRSVAGKRAGSLLGTIDRCLTGAGSRLLASRLNWPLTDPAAVNRRLDAVEAMVREAGARRRLRETLRGLPDVERALGRIALDRAGPRDLLAVADAIERGFALAAGEDAARGWPAEIEDAFATLRALPGDLGERLRAALADPAPALKRDGNFVRAGALPELDEARALRDDSRRVVADLQGRYVERTGLRALKVRHNNVLGYFVEVPEAQGPVLLAEGSGFTHRQTLASAMRFSTAELADLDRRIGEAGARALALELKHFDALRTEILDRSELLREGAEAIGVLDVAAALADLAAGEEWTRPLVDDSLAFRVEGARHPVVEAALRANGGPPFVRNGCDLSPPEGERHGAIWLLTGPNMGGKSTFLRQNALVAVLAQIGAFVPATHAHVGVVDRLFSRVGASDDLSEGRSTFMVEMVETAAILNQAGERTLVILDEIGRGTATYDGLSIAFAAVEHLHETNRCRALFATHFHEMTALSRRLPRLANVTVRVKEWRGEVIFLHEVAPGAADRSYGVQVARLAGLPPAVVDRARQVLAELERADANGAARKAAVVDDLPLFSAALRQAPPPPPPPAEPPPAVAALRDLDPDALSPREALEALYRLKGLLAG